MSNNTIQVFQLILLLILVGAVIYLLTKKGEDNFDNALAEIDNMRNTIDSVQLDLTHAVEKINVSIDVVDNMLYRIKEANESIGQIRTERDMLVESVREALQDNKEENQQVKDELKRLEQALIALRDRSRIYQTD